MKSQKNNKENQETTAAAKLNVSGVIWWHNGKWKRLRAALHIVSHGLCCLFTLSKIIRLGNTWGILAAELSNLQFTLQPQGEWLCLRNHHSYMSMENVPALWSKKYILRFEFIKKLPEVYVILLFTKCKWKKEKAQLLQFQLNILWTLFSSRKTKMSRG